MSDGNWFNYMPELGDPPTADLIERPSVTELFAPPARKPQAQAPPARKPVAPAPALETEQTLPEVTDGKARLTHTRALSFMLAGEAHFTLVSKKTGVRYTYRVSKATDRGDGRGAPWFVGLLTGPNNKTDYSYIGLIGATDRRFRTTAKSRMKDDSAPVKAFTWTWSWLLRGVEPVGVEMWNEGFCCVCGDLLTDPVSIAAGIGPKCAKNRAA